MLDLRRLFDKYKISWKDHGPNTSRGNINIACPLCNKTTSPDYGHHLGILEATGQWHCFRNPRHSGKYIDRILRSLKIPQHEFEDQTLKPQEQTVKQDDRSYVEFQYFEPAENSQEILDYLSKRFFENPIQACKKFNLKYAPIGKWAGRLIIPLSIGWTGRSLREHIEPRYLAHTSEGGYYYYGNSGATSVIIQEGALDSMRIACVTNKYDVLGKCSGRVSPAMLFHLRSKRYFSIYNVPDTDVQFLQYQTEMTLIRSYCTSAATLRAVLPDDIKDSAEMSEECARKWVYSVGTLEA